MTRVGHRFVMLVYGRTVRDASPVGGTEINHRSPSDETGDAIPTQFTAR